MDVKRKEGESTEDYLKRLFEHGDQCVANLEKTFADMKKDGVTGFCPECGCDIYNNKVHKCNE